LHIGQATVKRRAAVLNPKKIFVESQMVRRVKAYLNNLQVVTDEPQFYKMSLECEGAIRNTMNGPAGVPRGKQHASPAPSTTSSTSSTSDERKPPIAKFGK
jgi:Rap guanine nucleotide exchange factor 2